MRETPLYDDKLIEMNVEENGLSTDPEIMAHHISSLINRINHPTLQMSTDIEKYPGSVGIFTVAIPEPDVPTSITNHRHLLRIEQVGKVEVGPILSLTLVPLRMYAPPQEQESATVTSIVDVASTVTSLMVSSINTYLNEPVHSIAGMSLQQAN